MKKSAPKVFIDCRSCDRDYIRTEITFVNYVRDRQDADVHVLITTQQTGSGGLSGEESTSEKSVRGNFSANRVSPETKLRLRLEGEFEEDRFDINSDSIISTSSDKEAGGYYVKSLGDHWSAGGWLDLESSTYSNLDLQAILAPAIEYNFYPYYESTRRLLRGLNLDVFGSYSRIHDQLNLPKGGASLDEILLRQREFATDYDYSVSIGLNYTFGSVYSNVINPRFGR